MKAHGRIFVKTNSPARFPIISGLAKFSRWPCAVCWPENGSTRIFRAQGLPLMVRRRGTTTLIGDMTAHESIGGARSASTSVPLILLIEDNPSDVFLFRRALGKLGF